MMSIVMTVEEAGSGLLVAVAITEKKGAQTMYTFLRHVFERLENPFDHATNNVLERHRRTFKAEFLQHRRTRRIDDLIRAILAYDHSLERHAADKRGAASGHARGRRITQSRRTSARPRRLCGSRGTYATWICVVLRTGRWW